MAEKVTWLLNEINYLSQDQLLCYIVLLSSNIALILDGYLFCQMSIASNRVYKCKLKDGLLLILPFRDGLSIP